MRGVGVGSYRIGSIIDEMARVPDEELTTEELQEQLAELESAGEIMRALLIRRVLRLFEVIGADVAGEEPPIEGGLE